GLGRRVHPSGALHPAIAGAAVPDPRQVPDHRVRQLPHQRRVHHRPLRHLLQLRRHLPHRR
ncbi:hypothetical protein CFC21_045961, partial [Triticum aestivum]